MIFLRIKAFIVSVIFLITVMMIIVLMYLFKSHNRTIRRYWAKLQRFILGYKLIQEGKLDENAQLLIINHQSIVDIIVLEEVHPANLCWIGKKQITNLPIFGHVMKAPSMITVDREDRRSLIKLVQDVKERIANGRVIPIFPEGTRGNGKILLPFKPGAKFIAEKLNLTVQPIIITGAIKSFDSKNFSSSPATITITYLDSISTIENKNWLEDAREKMQDVLNKNLNKN